MAVLRRPGEPRPAIPHMPYRGPRVSRPVPGRRGRRPGRPGDGLRTPRTVPGLGGSRHQRKDRVAMMRDELLRQIADLPEDADVGLQIGNAHLDIAEVIVWG